MDYSSLLTHISTHFHKIFKECYDGTTFISPVFEKSEDIEILITISQILYIMSEKASHPILYYTLIQIIHIKCNEYVEQKWNKNLDQFTSTFATYLNSMLDNNLNSLKK